MKTINMPRKTHYEIWLLGYDQYFDVVDYQYLLSVHRKKKCAIDNANANYVVKKLPSIPRTIKHLTLRIEKVRNGNCVELIEEREI